MDNMNNPEGITATALGKESTEPPKKTNKKSTKPPRAFPQNGLEDALSIPRAIAEHNAGNPWGSEQLATALNYGSASSIFYLTASSRDYGFTTGTSHGKTLN